MKRYVLFDHDGVLVDTERWYFAAAERALAEVGFSLDKKHYLQDVTRGLGTWAHPRAAGLDEETIDRARRARNRYYQDYLRSQEIEIYGVIDVLERLSTKVRMAIVTTSKRADFDLIHEKRRILPFMDFVLAREDYVRAKPDPEPYLAGLRRFGASADEAVVVEDSKRGLDSAVAAGIDCVMVHNEFTAGQDFSLARHRIESLHELVDLLVPASGT